jgi:hypothetical protein
MSTLAILIVISVGEAHGLREESVSGSLSDILLCLHVVAGIISDEEVESGPADVLFGGGLGSAVVGAVALVRSHAII